MLHKDFFYITWLESDEKIEEVKINTKFTLNHLHRIFEGHFPGNPVVPGVCMIQIIKEILEASLGYKLLLRSSSGIKFLNVLVPSEGQEYSASLTYKEIDNKIICNSSINLNETVFLKFKGEYIRQENPG